MKIEYTENPLASKVILDLQDTETLKLKLKIAELEEQISMGCHYLEKEKIDEAKSYLDMEYIFNGKLDERVETIYNTAVDELAFKHEGDCTCVPCSCFKCYIEGMLGIDTIPKMNKYMGNIIEGVFTKVDTCNEAIKMLEAIEDKSPVIVASIDWLKNYQQTHLGK